MPRRLKLSRLQALATEVSAREGKPSFMCFYRRGFGVQLYGPAEQGNAGAQFALGRLYFHGRAAESHTTYSGQDGRNIMCSYTPAFEPHYPAAMKWLQQAADQGHTEARQLLEVVKLHVKDGVH
jgi:TPR repeat protein